MMAVMTENLGKQINDGAECIRLWLRSVEEESREEERRQAEAPGDIEKCDRTLALIMFGL